MKPSDMIPSPSTGNDQFWEVAFLIASVLSVLSLMVSIHSVSKHLRYFNAPRYQLYICRILLMVPVYALTSWLALLIPGSSLFLGAIRDSYEAYVIYTFFSLMTAYLGGEEYLSEWLEVRGHIRHPWPLRTTLRPISLGGHFLRRVKQGTLQFVFVKPFTAVLSLVLYHFGYYSEGSYSLSDGFIYISFINNVSVTISLYCLVLFYLATETRLEQFRPLPKFLCVKFVVFFSYWQSCVLQLLVLLGMLKSYDDAAILQNLFICAEMFVASIAHNVAFPCDEFMDEGSSFKPLLPNLIKVLDVHDVIEDGAEAFLKRQRQQEELAHQPV